MNITPHHHVGCSGDKVLQDLERDTRVTSTRDLAIGVTLKIEV
jgi:hypothetical protein